jgi:PKD repeat protein
MEKNTVESRQFRIDSIISNFFIFLIIPLLAIFGFKLLNRETPPEVSFDISGNNHMENQLIKFRNNTAGDHSYQWNFGDSTEIVEAKSPMHAYIKNGNYTVILTVDNYYKFQEELRIAPSKKETASVIIPRISGPKQITLGHTAEFTCNTKGVKSWEWKISGSNKVYSRRKTFRHTFRKPGNRTIRLIVDGNEEFTARKEVNIRIKSNKKGTIADTKPRKETKLEDKIPDNPFNYSAFKDIEEQNRKIEKLPSDEELTTMLLQIAQGSGDKDKFIQVFHSTNANLMAMCNGKLTSFEELLKDVEGENLSIKEFSTERKNDTSIVKVTIRYKKKKGLKFINL